MEQSFSTRRPPREPLMQKAKLVVLAKDEFENWDLLIESWEFDSVLGTFG